VKSALLHSNHSASLTILDILKSHVFLGLNREDGINGPFNLRGNHHGEGGPTESRREKWFFDNRRRLNKGGEHQSPVGPSGGQGSSLEGRLSVSFAPIP